MKATRRAIVGGLAGAGIAAAIARATGADAVRVTDFRRADDVDDSDAFRRALETGRPVHAPAAGGSGPEGRYLVATAEPNLPTGAMLFGDGPGRTIIARSYARPAPFLFHADSKSADPARNLQGIAFRDLSLEDDVVRRGFSEFDYLVMLNGVTGARFERVNFTGFRGDGLHLGSSTISAVERHNRDVVVRDCRFDGINANNRNAISVIDCDGLLIEDSAFLNCTRPGDGTPLRGDPMNPQTGLAQPGAIDCEPNGDRFAIIRNVVIRRNLFQGGGGNAVALNLRPNDAVDIAQQGFTITENRIVDRAGGFAIFGYGPGRSLAGTPRYELMVAENEIRGCATPFIVDGVRGVRITRNRIIECSKMAEIGYRGMVAEVEVDENRFERAGNQAPGHALWIRSSDRLALTGNMFVDCGAAGARNGVAIAFVDGVNRNLTLSGNRFASPDGRTAQAMTVFAAARIDAGSARVSANRVEFRATPVEALLGLGR